MAEEDGPDSGLAGEYIGVYRIQGRLGQGGMGEVLLAYDDRLRRPVAIKRIRHGRVTPESRERLRREARAVARLSHPAIVQVHDVVFADDSDSIVMEYVDGHSLARLLAEGRLAGGAAVDVARQVAQGLAAAHARGFVHRDLKAENVIVTPEGQAKILDFGLAKLVAAGDAQDSLTRDGEVVGTLRAMSPEQAAGGAVDARSDLFSLGVLLYETFTGRTPFRGGTPVESLRKVLEERPPSPRALRPELPRELSTLVDSLLEKDPGRRPQSATEVAGRLDEVSRLPEVDRLGPPSPATPAVPGLSDLPTGGEPPPAVAAGPAVPGRRPGARRGPWAVGAAALALLAAAAYLALRPRVEPRRVVVLPVEAPAGAEAELVALGIEDAALSALAELDGVEPLDGREAGGAVLPVAAARAAAADEVVKAVLECRAGECRVSLRRLRGDDGAVVRVAGPFWVPTAPEDFRDLAEAVRGHLLTAFPGHRSRAASSGAAVRDEDYAAFLALKHRHEAAEQPPSVADLEELEDLLRTSPGLSGAYLLAAGIARRLGDLERAADLLNGAAAPVSADPRLLIERFRVQVAAGDLDLAGATLAAAEEVAPGQTMTLRLRAELLAARGELEEAVREARKLVRRRSSWRNLGALADYELRLGRVEEARRHLDEALERSPGNAWVLAKQAEVEVRYGDLARAEEIYLRLIAVRPLRLYYTNLGWVRYVLADYAGAAASYGAALALDPDHHLTRFNLAAAREAAGEPEEARTTYRELVHELDEGGEPGGRGAQSSLLVAQCKARLGDLRGALELTQQTMRSEPEDRQDLFLAAQVYALLGERLTALHYVERALRGGIRPSWFAIPEFDALRSDPDFQALLENPSGAD